MTQPLLTIAIPNYNGGENLRRALLSCLRVDLPVDQYEILLVDNASTDASVELARQLSGQLPNLRVEVNKTNVGRVQNWNVALQEAKGQYLVFLFSGDEIAEAPQLAQKVAFMQQHEVGVLLCPKLLVREDGTEHVYEDVASAGHLSAPRFAQSQLNEANFPFAPIQGNVYHLGLIRARHLLFDLEKPIAGDQLFSFRLALYAREVGRWPRPHLRWYASAGRFHATISVGQLVAADLETLRQLEPLLDRPLNWPRIKARMLVRLLINAVRPQGSFKRTDEKEAAWMILRQAGGRTPLVLAWLFGETAFRALRSGFKMLPAKLSRQPVR